MSSDAAENHETWNYLERVRAAGEAPLARLSWLHVHAYEELRDVRLEFGPGVNLLLGKNGTGKTTLLELLARVVEWDFSPWEKREFDVEFCFESGESSWHARVKNERTALNGAGALSPSVVVDGSFDGLSVGLRGNGTEAWWLVNDRRARHPDLAQLRVDLHWALFFDEEHHWLSERVQVAMTPVRPARSGRFDEALGYLEQVAIRDGKEPALLYWGRKKNYVGIPLLHQPGRAWVQALEPVLADPTRSLTIDAGALGIAPSFLEGLGATDVFADLGRPEVHRAGDETVYSFADLSLWMHRRDGDTLRHQSWSWGQRRLVSFALYLADNPHFVVADELVNGLHYDWIELCLHELGERQAFLTSQNPVLVDLLPLESPEQVRRSVILCDLERAGSGETCRRWRNMTEAEAARLYEARSTGLQSTSEIMRFHGWW